MTLAARRVARPTIQRAYARRGKDACSGRWRCIKSWIVTTVAAGGKNGIT
jgi:hypothetical protein